LTEFFGEVVAVGEAAGARWIRLAEYNPPDLHPRNNLNKRLAAINEFAKTWKADDRKGPLRQIQKGIKTEVDFTLAYVVNEGKNLKVATPLCEKVLDMVHGLETGQLKLGIKNYGDLRTAQ
ncbi:MAG: hypothetical protein OEN50_14785, partial [Deltaproteobacteria bacterium]|nr:hypothetical protein [Deltaproteobacteria bacterium]